MIIKGVSELGYIVITVALALRTYEKTALMYILDT